MNAISVFVGSKFPVEYMTMLRRMVPGMRFLTDRREALQYQDLVYTGEQINWWAKIDLFHPKWKPLRPFFYVDLDTYILAPINDILVDDGKQFKMLRHLDHFGSGVMIIPREVDHIWIEWAKSPRRIMDKYGRGGDQEFLRTFDFSCLQSEYDGIYSYKLYGRKRCPDSARIVYFHGEPKPHNVKGWAGRIWKRFTQERPSRITQDDIQTDVSS